MERGLRRFVREKDGEEYITIIYPGSGHSITYGGTRRFNPEIHLNRWDQFATRIDVGREHFPCQLHSRPQNVIESNIPIGDGFDVIGDTNTPHDEHLLYIPHGGCWPEEKIRRMGGLANIGAILDHAVSTMRRKNHQFVRMICYGGKQAGMNQQDFHVHYLVNPENSLEIPFEVIHDTRSEAVLRDYWRNGSQTVLTDGPARVVCDSIFRASQCFIVSTVPDCSVTSVAVSIDNLLCLFAAGFTSDQGLAPDFKLMLEFWNGSFLWGFYSPVLNPHGVEDEAPRKGVHVHPWGPEFTLARLREFQK